MRLFVLALLCAIGLSGCGCGTTTEPDFGILQDMTMPPLCPSGVDAIGANRIACGGKDTQCLFVESPQVTITCHCECGKFWECDSVLAFCDGGA